MPAEIEVHEGELDGLPVVWRTAPWEGTPVLWIHGVPNSSEMWEPFLARAGGIAVDLPGFGRSGKPAEGDYTIGGYAAFLERFLGLAGVDRVRLAMHDWGAVGLAFAQRFPDRVERVVAINVTPFVPGYRWHRLARWWRRPVVGELAMGFTVRTTLKLFARRANGSGRPLPDAWVDQVLRHFDQGTQRAILRLYRASDPAALAAAGERLGTVTAPALVLWGDRDPYVPPRFADALAAAPPAGQARHVPDAGHWPWYDRPDVVDTVVEFLGSSIVHSGQ